MYDEKNFDILSSNNILCQIFYALTLALKGHVPSMTMSTILFAGTFIAM